MAAEDPPPDEPTEEEESNRSLTLEISSALGTVLAFSAVVIIFALIGGGVYLFVRASTAAQISPDQNPLNNIFASRLVVAFARIALLFAAGYIVLSIIARIARGEWLSRVGPVQVSESVQTVSAEGDRLVLHLQEALRENDRLREEVGELSERLEVLDGYLDSVIDFLPDADDEGDEGE